MHIDHINIKAEGELLERVRAFYCSVLGLEEGFRPAFRSAGHWLYAGERPIVHLSEGAAAGPGGSPLDHVAFQTSGLEAMRARLDSLSIGFRSNYIPELDMTQLFFEDPAGNGIEINFPGES